MIIDDDDADDDLVLRKKNPGIIIIQVILGQVADHFVLFSLCLYQGNLMFRALLLNPVTAAGTYRSAVKAAKFLSVTTYCSFNTKGE